MDYKNKKAANALVAFAAFKLKRYTAEIVIKVELFNFHFNTD